MTFALKVSKKNYDVSSADPKELVVDSTKETLVGAIQGEIKVSSGAGGSEKTFKVDHNLGFQPAMIMFSRDEDSQHQDDYTYLDGVNTCDVFTKNIDDKQIEFAVNPSAGFPDTDFWIKYYIFADNFKKKELGG